MKKQKILVIVGPTASGKTLLGIKVAKRFGGEIISADSRAIYKKMDIGTAKPDQQDADGFLVECIAHYGFDLVEPDEHFHAFDFKVFAQKKIADIASRGKLPIVVGGTGLYISGLVDNFDFEGGIAGEPKFDVLQIGIKVDREILYHHINKRVDEMIDKGLIGEVQKLYNAYGCKVKSMTGIGYRQICEYLNGSVSLNQAIERLKRDTRHYAKRQMTWFKRDSRIHWIEEPEQAIALIESFL